MKLNVLGTTYTVEKKKWLDEPVFQNSRCLGFCDSHSLRIVYCDLKTNDNWKDESEEGINRAEKEILRHEIVHAFLSESGLNGCAHHYDGAWSYNEEMIDWIAIMGPRLYDAWVKAKCI